MMGKVSGDFHAASLFTMTAVDGYLLSSSFAGNRSTKANKPLRKAKVI
jgi:hypothetical protein